MAGTKPSDRSKRGEQVRTFPTVDRVKLTDLPFEQMQRFVEPQHCGSDNSMLTPFRAYLFSAQEVVQWSKVTNVLSQALALQRMRRTFFGVPTQASAFARQG